MRIASVSVHTLYIPEEHLAADVVFFCLFGIIAVSMKFCIKKRVFHDIFYV